MAKKQLEELLNSKLLGQISGTSLKFIDPNKKSNFSKTKDGKIGDILKQRHNQRQVLFYFALSFVVIVTLIVFSLILYQAYLNVSSPETEVRLIDDRTLQIIVTGVFVQFVGLVGIITKSIWNDKPYLDAGVIGKKGKGKDE